MPKKVLCKRGDREKWFEEMKIPEGWTQDIMVGKEPGSGYKIPDGMKLVPVDDDEGPVDDDEGPVGGNEIPEPDEKNSDIPLDSGNRGEMSSGNDASGPQDEVGTSMEPKAGKIK